LLAVSFWPIPGKETSMDVTHGALCAQDLRGIGVDLEKHFRDALRAERDGLQHQLDETEIAIERHRSGAAGVADLEVAIALAATARRALDDIVDAIDRLDKGTFGLCAGCRTPIPLERLKAMPRARFCVPCEVDHTEP
jgi:DnaK suppressor protein